MGWGADASGYVNAAAVSVVNASSPSRGALSARGMKVTLDPPRAISGAAPANAICIGLSSIDADFEVRFRTAIERGELKHDADPAALASHWTIAEAHWRLLRAKYLLY
jgi:hypothetical protein